MFLFLHLFLHPAQPGRLKDLERKMWEQVMGPGGSKEQADRAQSVDYCSLLGWNANDDGEDCMTAQRLNALLDRALAYKAAYDKW